MEIDTKNLRLHTYLPENLLALIEGEDRFEESFGLPAAKGLRAFIATDLISPAWFALLKASRAEDPWIFGFAVVHRASATVIGNVMFKGPPDIRGGVEIAYAIVPALEGKGFATEAAGAAAEFAFRDPRVRTVLAHTLPEPSASTRVLEKLGFTNAGEVMDPVDGRVWRWEKNNERA